ncbi:MAG: radical SAM/SPASM domain-containing protein [Arenicellales bacterium WSBS_2016_MAG_OTU3]
MRVEYPPAVFDSAQPYSFHIELTDKCNAGCPMCPRTLELVGCTVDKSVVGNDELKLADFQQHFNEAFCKQTGLVVFSGVLGDPLAASQCLQICDYLTSNGVQIAISTNASLRNTRWWRELGDIMQRTNSRVEFHIDGLHEVNALYRVHTSFKKIMQNAEAYLGTGAQAEWHFILFKHNQHQVEDAFKRSRKMGFKRFVLIDTVRFGNTRFKYQLPNHEIRYLEASTKSGADFDLADAKPDDKHEAARWKRLSGMKAKKPDHVIWCKSQEQNRAYIGAKGDVSACCWVFDSDEQSKFYKQNDINLAGHNIRKKPLQEILHSEPFVSLYSNAWSENSLSICQRKCGDMRRNVRTFN